MILVNYLECDHCGGPAVYATPDRFGKVLFHEGDADRCETCNIRGSIDINDDGEEEGPYATWVSSNDPFDKCVERDCVTCWEDAPADAKEGS